MSGNDVKIAADAERILLESRWGQTILAREEVAALREHFTAERMPEDVQKLVGEMRRSADSQRRQQPRPGEWAADHGWTARADLLDRAIAALEAAYSKGADHGPR